jgi:hypothetical protein
MLVAAMVGMAFRARADYQVLRKDAPPSTQMREVERIIGREQVLGLHKSNGKPLFIEEIAAKAREAVR